MKHVMQNKKNCFTFHKKSIIIFPAVIISGIIILFFGMVGVAKAEILNPDGLGFYTTGWQNTGGAGDGVFSEVNQYPTPDEDMTYNKTSTDLSQQSYSLANTNKTAGTIRNIKIWARAKAIGTADSIKLFLRIGGIDYFSSAIPATTSYADYSYQWTTNPSNSSNWSVSDLNSLEAGFQLVGGTSEHRITMMYAQVEYNGEIKTLKYHVAQKILPISSGGIINEQFNFYIADDLDEIKSAHIEIKGVALPINPLTLDVSVDEIGVPYPTGSPRLKTFNIDASGRILPFKFNYDVTDYFKTFITDSGDYSRYFNLKVTGNSVYVLSAKLIVTYSWVKPPVIAGAYRQFGVLTSSTFDTGSTAGAAYNSILWKGTKPAGTRVKLQIATSDNAGGPFNFIGGDSCLDSSFWEPSSNTPQETKCFSQLNNKRYFRYKIRLESNSPSYDQTPQVDDIVINFSP